MSTTSRRDSTPTNADPWWGFDDPAAPESFVVPAKAPTHAAPSARRRRRSVRRSLPARVGWLLVGILVAPFDLLRRLLARSPRLRRLAIRATIVLAILAVLASSVGVILINNVVIGRTAELGELDERRRELRRENALLGAQAARLSSPDVVFRRASKDLGMVPTENVPQFIYLVPGSKTLTPWQRQHAATKVAAAGTRVAATKAKVAAADTPPDAKGNR